jgi:hypothetical protein
MVKIPAQTRETQLVVHAVAAAAAMASANEVVHLDLGGITETDPRRRKAAVADRLRAAMGDLEVLIRSKTVPPARPARALLGARLAENGEFYDPRGGTYAPGPGFEALLKGLLLDTEAAADKAARSAGIH